jgi:hypothetical protein
VPSFAFCAEAAFGMLVSAVVLGSKWPGFARVERELLVLLRPDWCELVAVVVVMRRGRELAAVIVVGR